MPSVRQMVWRRDICVTMRDIMASREQKGPPDVDVKRSECWSVKCWVEFWCCSVDTKSQMKTAGSSRHDVRRLQGERCPSNSTPTFAYLFFCFLCVGYLTQSSFSRINRTVNRVCVCFCVGRRQEVWSEGGFHGTCPGINSPCWPVSGCTHPRGDLLASGDVTCRLKAPCFSHGWLHRHVGATGAPCKTHTHTHGQISRRDFRPHASPRASTSTSTPTSLISST